LIFTFVVVFVSCRDIVETSLLNSAWRKGSLTPQHVAYWKKMLTRTVMILLTLAMALAVPNVSDLVGLIVGVSNSTNSFILPMLIYLKVCHDERRNTRSEKRSLLHEQEYGSDADYDPTLPDKGRGW